MAELISTLIQKERRKGEYANALKYAELALELNPNTLPHEARKFVRYNENGILDVEYLAKNTKGIDDINLKAALIVGRHETTAFVHLTDKLQSMDQDGNVTQDEVTGTAVKGFTTAPDGSDMQSVISGKIDVMINKNLSEIGKVRSIGHELFGHARFYVEGRPWQHDLRQGFGGYDFNRPLLKAAKAHAHQGVLNLLRLKRSTR